MLDVLEDEPVEGRRNMVDSTSVLGDERMMDALEETVAKSVVERNKKRAKCSRRRQNRGGGKEAVDFWANDDSLTVGTRAVEWRKQPTWHLYIMPFAILTYNRFMYTRFLSIFDTFLPFLFRTRAGSDEHRLKC